MNNTTLIIGASSSFGEPIARNLSAQGHTLILTDSGKMDVTNEQSIEAIIGSCQPVQNLVYSVGAPIEFTKFEDEQWPEYETHWQTQVKGLWQVVQSLLKHRHPLENIAVIGSAVTFDKPMPRLGAYTTAKYALLGLVKAMAVELAPRGIKVNMVSPGATGEGLSKDWPRLMLEAGDSANPSEVASVVASLLDEGNNRTGENIKI